jgi:hypothetical protein
MEALRGERRYNFYSLSTSTLDGMSGQRHAPAALYPWGKDPPVPIVQEAGWAPEPVWTQRLEKNSLPPPEIEPRSPGRPARSQTLYCLSYPAPLNYYILVIFREQYSLRRFCLSNVVFPSITRIPSLLGPVIALSTCPWLASPKGITILLIHRLTYRIGEVPGSNLDPDT